MNAAIPKWLWVIIIIAFLSSSFWIYKVEILLEALDPPVLPEPNTTPPAEWDNGQNWSTGQAERYHFEGQGSRTFNMPVEWFLALEAPATSTLGFMLGEEELFSNSAYLSRFGFIPAQAGKYNPYGLPIGFATTPYQNLIGIDEAKTAIGLTCAACHTGQLLHENKRYVFQGGSASVDLGQLTLTIGAALGQTGVASSLPVFNGRFDRFAKRVLKGLHTAQNISKLKTDLGNVIKDLAAQPMGIDVTEGFGRLDALNRIGNQVFALDPGRNSNYVNLNSPVNFPHIWSSSWFDWVQYDGSIMQPLIRNAGEAMGTAANTNFTAPRGQGRFSNGIPMKNLMWIESNLAGNKSPGESKSFSGLRAPAWPDAFGEIDQTKADAGAALYEQHCKGCHLPALTKAVASGAAPESEF